MYEFSIIHLRVTYRMSRDDVWRYMIDTEQEMYTTNGYRLYDSACREVEAYQQVLMHGQRN